MKRIIMLITAIAVMFGGLAFMAPVAANADEGTQSGSEITSESSSSASDSAAVTSLAHAGGTITAKTVAYVKAKGTPKAQQTKCRTIKKSASFWTSYINSYGKEVWHWKWYPKGKRFCNVGGVMRDPVCHNKVKIGVPKAKKPRGIIITGQIKVIAAFKFVAEAEAKVTATAKATAKAWCQNEWTYAEAYASANAYSYAYARARAIGTTRAKAKAGATGAATQLSLSASFRGTVEVDAKAKAKATATADAYAKVTCGEGPDTTPAPDLLEIDTINDVLVNNTRTITIRGTVAPGHTATLFASALNGGSITAGKTQTVSGSFTAQVTYMAPSEVPGANNGVAAGHDQVKVTLTQDDGQKDDISTNQFEIRPAPVDPL